MAHIYLANKRLPKERVTIYHIGNRVNNGVDCGFPTIDDFKSYAEKDSAMIAGSSHDIAYACSEANSGMYGQWRKKVCPVCNTFILI